MQNRVSFKKKFYKAVECLECCSDTIIKNKKGIVTERGMSMYDNAFITYDSENNLIKVYVDNNEVIALGENSPIISMFEDLISNINEL